MIRAVAVAALHFAVAIPAAAQWKDCTPPQTTGSYHLFIDDFRLPNEATASADMKTLRDALSTAVRNQLDAMQMQNLPSLQRMDCPGRFPSQGDFTKAHAEWMDNRDVVMELWTVLRPADQQHYAAEFDVAVIPAVLLNLGGAQTPALFTVAYTFDPHQRRDQLLALLQNHPQLTAYALIGAGLRAVENGDYDYASSFLCRGLAELQQVPATPDNRRLMAYVDDASRKVVADAKKDGGYVGPLKLLAANRPGCAR